MPCAMDSNVFEIMKSSGILPGTVVVSTAGHDKGRVYLVIARTDKIASVADGRARTADRAKPKRVTHLKALGIAGQPDEVVSALASLTKTEAKNIFIRDSIRRFFDDDGAACKD